MIPDIDQKVAKFKTAKKIQNVWDTFVGKFVTKKLKISANLVTLLPIKDKILPTNLHGLF